MDDSILNALRVLIIGIISYTLFLLKTSSSSFSYIKSKNKEELQVDEWNDRSWFGPLWKTFLTHYDQQWDETRAQLKSIGCHYENRRIESSRSFGPKAQTNVHIIGRNITNNNNNDATNQKPILLLLPGYKATSTLWTTQSILTDLSKKYCIITVDYPFDLGRSTPGHKKIDAIVHQHPHHGHHNRVIKCTQFTPPKPNIQNIITFIRDILQQLQIEKIDALGGFSLGGYISSQIALHAPDLLSPNAKVLLLAPPACLSRFRFSFVIPLLWYKFRRDVFGIAVPASQTNVGLLERDVKYEIDAKTITIDGPDKDFDYDAVKEKVQAKDNILKLGHTLPPLPFPIRQLKMDELKKIADAFDVTYVSLEWDVWYDAHKGYKRALEAGMESILIEKTTHRFVTTQPKKFCQLVVRKFLQDK